MERAKAALEGELSRVTGEGPSKVQVVACPNCADLEELVTALKEKCSLASSKSEQVQILTLAPASWTIEHTAEQFHVSKYLVRKARELKKAKGILSKPEAKEGKTLSKEVEQAVIDFYKRDDISRLCPGKKDFVAVRKDGQKHHEQK